MWGTRGDIYLGLRSTFRVNPTDKISSETPVAKAPTALPGVDFDSRMPLGMHTWLDKGSVHGKLWMPPFLGANRVFLEVDLGRCQYRAERS